MIRYLPRAVRMLRLDGMAFFSETKLAEYQTQVAALKPMSPHCSETMTVDQGLHHLNLACGHAHGFYKLEDESYLTSCILVRSILVDWFPEQPLGLRLPTGFKLSYDEHFDFYEEHAKLLTIIQAAWNKRSASEWVHIACLERCHSGRGANSCRSISITTSGNLEHDRAQEP